MGQDNMCGICGLYGKKIEVIEGGVQPMHDGHVHVVWNGEIYNHKELRTTMQERGYSFATESDTEVILKMYQEYGADCVQYFRGMFAIALYDDNREALYLWRDRFGVKPLFYKQTDKGLLFASEIKGILAFEGTTTVRATRTNQWDEMENEVDSCRLAMMDYLRYHSPVAPYTVYPDIYEMEPGGELIFHRRQIATRRYYVPTFAPSKPGRDISALAYELPYDECDAMAELRSHIYKAVERRMVREEPMGVLLSGGLDSSYIAALAAGMHYAPVYTYTLRFQCEANHSCEKGKDTLAAEYLAKKLGTFHTTYTVTGREALESLPEIVAAFDQPYSGGVSLYWLMRQVPAAHRVFLSGDGADEAFWGYPFHSVVYDRLHGSQKEVGTPLTLPGMSMSVWSMLLTEDMQERLHLCGDIEGENWQRDDSAMSRQRDDSAMSRQRDRRGVCHEGEIQENMLAVHANQHYYEVLLPGQVFRYVDTLSTTFGKEIRAPFMDQRLVEYAAELPVWQKMRNGDRKYLLKRVASNILPSEICNRRKETFLPPIALWMQCEWKEYIVDMLSFERVSRTGHFKPEMVQYLLHQFYEDPAGQEQTAQFIWSILMYELWCESS